MTPTWLWRDSERFRACIYCVFVYVYSSGVTQCYLNAKPSNKSKQIGQLEAVFFLQAHLLPSLAKPPDLASFYTQKLVRTGRFARLLITWLAIKPRQWLPTLCHHPGGGVGVRGWQGAGGALWCHYGNRLDNYCLLSSSLTPTHRSNMNLINKQVVFISLICVLYM